MSLTVSCKPRVAILCTALACFAVFGGEIYSTDVHAQAAAAPEMAPATANFSNEQLDSLTAPIALYPDPLLAQVLMGSTFPDQIQAAAQWITANPKMEGDEAVKAVASQPWDPSVQSLVAFPQVLATMASKPEWVAQIGDAFLAQPSAVMDSVQRLRKQAQQAGNLKSTEQQRVVVEQGAVQIVPANPQVIYVPSYNPTVVYGAWPYPAYPPVYIPPPYGYPLVSGFATGLAFGAGIAAANALWGDCNWNRGEVNVNVNKYNNINQNNKINSSARTSNWQRNASNTGRTNVGAGRTNAGGVDRAQRDQYRGRDQARGQAQQTLQSRTGQSVGGNASQRAQNIQRGGAGSAGVSNRAQSVNRDNALVGAGDAREARQDTQRGQASRQSMAERGNGRGARETASRGGQTTRSSGQQFGGGGRQQMSGGGAARTGGVGGARPSGGGGARGGGGGGGGRGRR